MKKLMAASVLALLVLASSQQSASAWHSCRFSIGMNFECHGGGNCILWGLLRGGPSPEGWYPGLYDTGHGPLAEWHAPAPTPVTPNGRPQSSPAGAGQGAYAGYYYNPYYYHPGQPYANYPTNNPYSYYLMSYPGARYNSAGTLNFYGN
jgi:hypothetical protein